MNEFLDLTLVEASELTRKGLVSASELVAATVDQLESSEPFVHAYSMVLTESARFEAAKADRIPARSRGPLHGVPIAVKDVFYTSDAITTAGSRVFASFRPKYEATAVDRLRAAGAIIIGKTTCQELAYGQQVLPTRNPWRLSHAPGGSSAGSAVAVASRSAFGALGTDTGGSIRIPASLNGVVGLKPTFGRVSRRGVFPLSSSLDHVGPIARTVGDCALLLGVLAGFDPLDRTSSTAPVDDFLGALHKREPITLGIDRSYFFGDKLSTEVRNLVDMAIDQLEEAGCRLVEVAIPDLDFVFPAALTILLADATTYYHSTTLEHGSEFESGTRSMLYLGEFLTARHYITAQRVRTRIQEAVKTTFVGKGIDALVAPTLPWTATDAVEPESDFEAVMPETALGTYLKYSLPASLLGLPAMSIPCGFDNGLPVGFQLIGRPLREGTLFQAGHLYEDATRWYSRRPHVVGARA